MEAFESFVALAMEAERLVVSEAIKFPVRLETRRNDHKEIQTHGYEVDLVGANADRLVPGEREVVLRLARCSCRARHGRNG